MRVGFGAMAQQHVLAIGLCQMKGSVRDGWKTIVVHTDEVCKRMRSHESERMCLIFGFELRGQVHAKLPRGGLFKNDV
jgi:hypothetical protein